MNKKLLSQDLINNNFNLTKYHTYEKVFQGLNINVIIYSSLFGKIKMIGILYKFQHKLEEEFHDEVWNKSINLIDDQNPNLKIGSLGFDYIEASILDCDVLNNINSNTIIEYCNIFAKSIKPLLDDYNL